MLTNGADIIKQSYLSRCAKRVVSTDEINLLSQNRWQEGFRHGYLKAYQTILKTHGKSLSKEVKDKLTRETQKLNKDLRDNIK